MPDVMPSSKEQNAILAFIREFISSNGYAPTYREIKQSLNISSLALVNYHLNALERDGFLTRTPGKIRGISLVEAARQSAEGL